MITRRLALGLLARGVEPDAVRRFLDRADERSDVFAKG